MIENNIYFRPKTIAKIIAKITTTVAIIPIIINNFFKGKKTKKKEL
jgi:hypothetical protein